MTVRAIDVGETCPRCRSRVSEDADGCYSCGCDHGDDDGQGEEQAWADWHAISCSTCGGASYPIAYEHARPTRFRCRVCSVESVAT